MKTVNKGSYGYIKKHRIIEICKALLMLLLSVGIYYLGLFSTGSNKNLLTFVAVLGCLPMAKFAVNAVMFIKAKGCSENLYALLLEKGITPTFYDLYMTAYKENYSFSAFSYKKGNCIFITEDEKMNVEEAKAHIINVLETAGIKGQTVSIYTDVEKFINRCIDLNNLADIDRDNSVLFENILSVSL